MLWNSHGILSCGVFGTREIKKITAIKGETNEKDPPEKDDSSLQLTECIPNGRDNFQTSKALFPFSVRSSSRFHQSAFCCRDFNVCKM